jgi:predicted small lipoprotein YifL
VHTIKTILLISICTALLCACGNKGPLYLPDEETTVEQSSPEDADTRKENKKKESPASR